MSRWLFAGAISQSTLDGRCGSNACTIISLIFGKAFLTLNLPFPSDGPLNELWFELFVKCIRLGNRVYDNTQGASARNLAPEEAAQALHDQDLTPVSLQAALPVRLSDSHAPTRLGYQLARMADRRVGALFVYNGKTVSILSSGDGCIFVADSHLHGRNGAVFLKAHISRSVEVLQSLESLLDMDEGSFGNLVLFT